MAREPQPLIRRSLLFTILPACALLSLARAGERATVLLAPHPDRLVLCNRYQQRLTSTEAGSLLPFELMIVENEDGTLSDGLTKCVVLRIRSEAYYLLRGNDADLPPGVSLIRGVDVLADTLRVLPRQNVVLESPDGASRRSLPGGTLLVRLFGLGERFFVRQASAAFPLSGWVQQREASSWEVIHSSARATPGVSLARARSVAEDEIAGINAMLHALYVRQGGSGDGGAIPRLLVEGAPAMIRCRMVPSTAAHTYRTAFRTLAEHLSRRLGDRSVSCSAAPDGVTITLLDGLRR